MRKAAMIVALAAVPALALAEGAKHQGQAEPRSGQETTQSTTSGSGSEGAGSAQDQPTGSATAGSQGAGTAQEQPMGSGQEQRSEQQQGTAGAQQEQRGEQDRQARAGGQEAKESVVGTVEALQDDKLSLKNKLGETHDFAIDDQTRFTRRGQPISKDQIGEGAEVRAAFTGEKGSYQATEIILMQEGAGSTGASPQGQQGAQGQQDQPAQQGQQPEQREEQREQQQGPQQR